MYINGRIDENEVNFLIDSGAGVSIINPEIFDKISQNQKPKLQKEGVKMVGAGGKNIPFHGTGVFKFEIDSTIYEHTFWVADINLHGILGFDFLRKNKCLLDFAQGKIALDNLPNSPYTEDSDQIFSVMLKETMTLPAESETIVPAQFIQIPTKTITGTLKATYEFMK